MSGFLRESWNYLRLGFSVYRCFKEWERDSTFSHGAFEALIKDIHCCGSVAIKFVQWVKPLLELLVVDEKKFCTDDYEVPWWLRKLDVFYEDCQEHSVNHTLHEYTRMFHENLTDTHEIMDLLGSGSIGQVYLLKHKDTEELSVIKVIHPHVESQIDTFEKIYKCAHYIPPFRQILSDIPINLSDFIVSFRKQCDMIQESNNLLMFKNIYRSNQYIRIPDIYKISKSVLVMEYVKGEIFEKSTLTQYEKSKIFTHLYLFMRSNIVCDNFNHGDLHKGNWKIHEKGIVVYDFGFCWSLPKNKLHLADKCIRVFEGGDNKNLSKTISKLTEIMFALVLHPHIKNKGALREQIYEHIQNSRFVGKSNVGIIVQPISVIKLLVEFCNGRYLKIDHNLVQFLIIFVELQRLGIRYGFSATTHSPVPDIKVFKERYANCLNFCKTYKIFPRYVKYMEDRLSELQITRKSIFDTVDFTEDIRKMALI